MAYKVLDIYKDLPGTNCGDCGRPGCFAFASAVYLEGLPLGDCPHLDPAQRTAMETKLRQSQAADGGKKPERSEQALEFLRGKLRELEFHAAARRCGAEYDRGPPETMTLEFLGQRHRITRDEVVAEGGEAPTVWVKIFLLIYATRTGRAPRQGRWVAYRELPNTVSKAKSFEGVVDRLAVHFDDDPGALEGAIARLGGTATAYGAAQHAYVIRALPRVELLFLFWEREEEFPARASLLLDGGVLDCLDQEAIVFLAEAFVQRMMGQGLRELVP